MTYLFYLDLLNYMAGILAHKLEMTRVIKGSEFIPVTLLKVPSLKVVQVKTKETDGYNALVVGILKKGKEGILKEDKKTLSFNEFSKIREVSLSEEDLAKYKVGDDLGVDSLEGTKEITMTSLSKGRGFAGAMKKWNFHGGPKTHGSKFHRALGSIGNRKPTRTHKGKKMHGHMGNKKVTLRGISIELMNKDLSVIGVKGPVPGARNSLVTINF